MESMPTSTPAISDSPLPGARGFTLIELALALVILAVLLAFAAPRLMDLSLVRREAAAERLATVLGYLHDEASLRGETFRLTIDIDDASYAITTLEPEGVEHDELASEAAETPLARTQILPDGVRVDSVVTADTVAQAGSIDLLFFPDGDGAGVRITFLDETGGASVVTFDGVTGRTRVSDLQDATTGAK
jgi:prepilin-type N-terminal cleavage/methylation domain-containing protein